MIRITLPKQIDVLIVSFGGVGTTFLLEHISKYKRSNQVHNEDGFKHTPVPPISFNRNLRCVYMFGNPQTAVISLFRRGIQHHHSTQMQALQRKPGCTNLNELTIDQYAEFGRDAYGISSHFENWSSLSLNRSPIMFLRYESLYDNLDKLSDFLGIPFDSASGFPPQRKRASNPATISSETRQKLDDIYGDVDRQFSELSDVFIQEPKSLCDANFRRKVNLYSRAIRALLRERAQQCSQSSKSHIRNRFPNLYQKSKQAIKGQRSD